MPPTQPKTPAEFDDHFYQAALRELVDHGLQLSRGLIAQAAAAPPPQPADKTHPSHRIVLSYDRIARSVRRTTALARELAFPKPPRPEPNRSEPATRAKPRAKPAKERLLRPEDFEDADNPDWRQNWRNYLAKLTDAELDQLEAEMAADEDESDIDSSDRDEPATATTPGTAATLGTATTPGTAITPGTATTVEHRPTPQTRAPDAQVPKPPSPPKSNIPWPKPSLQLPRKPPTPD